LIYVSVPDFPLCHWPSTWYLVNKENGIFIAYVSHSIHLFLGDIIKPHPLGVKIFLKVKFCLHLSIH
jgi:hypothetical protein